MRYYSESFCVAESCFSFSITRNYVIHDFNKLHAFSAWLIYPVCITNVDADEVKLIYRFV